MRTLLCIIFTTLFYNNTTCVFAQQSHEFTSSKISFSQIEDTVIKHELATFTTAGKDIFQNSLSGTQLTEIPINTCSESDVSFYKYWGKGHSEIRLYFKQNPQNITLDSIFVVIKSHLWVRIPNHTFMGINQLYPCPIIPDNKRKKIYSPHYRAFQSKDQLRYYIYLHGGSDSNRYEATWVISGSRYAAFVADYIPSI
jgi:hypothetical protein